MNIPIVYLDSNVVIDMCEGRRNRLRDFVLASAKNKTIVFPFSSCQVAEITKKPLTHRCNERLSFLEAISNNIYFVHSAYDYEFRVESPNSVYETINESQLEVNPTELFANLVPLDSLKLYRKMLGLDPSILNNMTGIEAVAEINNALSAAMSNDVEAPRTIKELLSVLKKIIAESYAPLWENIGTTEEHMSVGWELQGVFSLLETFGYWPDSKGVYAKGSRFADSQHILNAQHCNVLVTNDKGMKYRAEAAYDVLGLSTKVVFTTEYEAQCYES